MLQTFLGDFITDKKYATSACLEILFLKISFDTCFLTFNSTFHYVNYSILCHKLNMIQSDIQVATAFKQGRHRESRIKRVKNSFIS